MCYNNKYIIIISIRQYSCTKPHSFVPLVPALYNDDFESTSSVNVRMCVFIITRSSLPFFCRA